MLHPLKRFTPLGVTFTVTSPAARRTRFVPSQNSWGALPAITLHLEEALMAVAGELDDADDFIGGTVFVEFVADDPVVGEWVTESADTGLPAAVFSLN
jgi:hypothetical protein